MSDPFQIDATYVSLFSYDTLLTLDEPHCWPHRGGRRDGYAAPVNGRYGALWRELEHQPFRRTGCVDGCMPPTPAALHVLVAHSLPELSEKLEKASRYDGQGQ